MAGAQPLAPRAQPSGGAAMERQELAGGAEPGASPDGEFQAVVQRTQVLLLAGETWEPDGAQAALSSFAHQVLPVARRSGSLSPAPPSAPPAGQLIFFLCRAASLRGRAERLREVLRGVREQSRGAPAALVAVIVQPQPEEEAEARRRLEELLLEVFQPPGPGAAPRVELHTAVFRPGRPEGALEVKKAACEALREEPEDAVWVSRATLFKVLGALCVACAGIIGSQYMNTSI